ANTKKNLPRPQALPPPRDLPQPPRRDPLIPPAPNCRLTNIGASNASSKPCYGTGPTPPATRAPITGAERSPPGSATTTSNDPTAPSATRPPPAVSQTTDQRHWELHLARAH